MLRRIAYLLAALGLAAPIISCPALAAGVSGFAATAAGYSFAQGGAPRLNAQAVGPVAIAGMPVVFEETTIGQIIGHFGGTVSSGKDSDEVAYEFVCYGMKDRTLWLRADGDSSESPITMIATEQGAPQSGWGCVDAPDTLDTVSFGIPGLGAPTEEVAARLGTSPQDAEGQFGYQSEVPSDATPGAFVSQTILYRISSGTVNAIAVSQKTSG